LSDSEFESSEEEEPERLLEGFHILAAEGGRPGSAEHEAYGQLTIGTWIETMTGWQMGMIVVQMGSAFMSTSFLNRNRR